MKWQKKYLQEIENEVNSKWNINKFITIHRIGTLKVSEKSVLLLLFHLGTEKKHLRHVSLALTQLKKKSPIWKKEFLLNQERNG